ncbi:MAG: peptide deformylase [Pseudomonadota bacterium]
MPVLTVLTYPDARLKEVAKPVDSCDGALRTLVHDLETTMRASPGGVGIAAPQVGVLLRAVIVDVSIKKNIAHHGRMVLINPEILLWEDMAVGREGCMSVPDYTGNVMRAQRIKVQAYNEFGHATQYECVGYEARAVQHELDHLDGMLFIDRLVSRRHDLFARVKKN